MKSPQSGRRIWRCIFFAAAVILSGCATVDPSVVQSRTAGKSILVASNVGSSLSLLWIGTTVFNNEQGQYAAPDFRLDEVVLSTATSALLAEKRYQSVGVVEKLSRSSEGFPNSLRGKADFLVLIEPSVSNDVIFGTNQVMRGVGVMQRSMFGTKPRTIVYAVLKGEVFDLRIGESLGEKRSTAFLNISTPLESGPKITTAALEETTSSAKTRTQAAVLSMLSALGLVFK